MVAYVFFPLVYFNMEFGDKMIIVKLMLVALKGLINNKILCNSSHLSNS